MYVWKGIITWLIIGAAPVVSEAPSITRQQVDLIELNHYIDEDGREVFRQLIFYDWSKSYKRFHVRARGDSSNTPANFRSDAGRRRRISAHGATKIGFARSMRLRCEKLGRRRIPNASIANCYRKVSAFLCGRRNR